jgi:hypothetical protein
MLKGLHGQKRPAATGEIAESKPLSGKVRSGKSGAEARAKNLNQEEREAIAKKVAAKRWG